MTNYKTPGVYVEEISTLPPSVAEASTAVPAFIGYTEIGPGPGEDGSVQPLVARINTMLEYEAIFGGAPPSSFAVATRPAAGDPAVREVASVGRVAPAYDFLLYYALSLYFRNGGGSSYIVSVGDYRATPGKGHFEAGLAALEKEDEPTLVLLTDSVNLDSADYYDLTQQSLAQCHKLGDRFAIIDVPDGPGKVAEFRDSIGTNALMYGAAYHPYLRTTLTYAYDERQVNIDLGTGAGGDPSWGLARGDHGIVVRFTGPAGDTPRVRIVNGAEATPVAFSFSAARTMLVENVNGKTGADVVAAWTTFTGANDPQGFQIMLNGDGTGDVPNTANANVELAPVMTAAAANNLAAIKSTNTGLYNQVKTAMNQQRVVLPPGPAVAGIYARVDRNRGVWKAPANESVSSVIGPVLKITHDDQEGLNVDPTAGKSINAIRAFTGKGSLVWGARTLAGNDNEWRYVSVRRLFNMIEESTQKATAFAVFEPNDATTWLKVRAMIESYLFGLWERGALAGPTAESAYFVNVGLGKTMTAQDVLEGRMIVEIGIAAVRPAEFIILRFTHQLQQA
jgi:hypothetical protein